jgi:hypothetical protein
MGLVIVGANGGKSITVTVIDTRDHVGWAAAATRIGEYEMTNVPTFVASVHRAVSGGNRIGRLNILDHGYEEGFQIGDDWILLRTLSQYRNQLASINPYFADDGWVHVQGCNTGNARPLLQELANMWGRKVVAGTGLQNPVYRINTGTFIECLPNNAGCRRSANQWGGLGF